MLNHQVKEEVSYRYYLQPTSRKVDQTFSHEAFIANSWIKSNGKQESHRNTNIPSAAAAAATHSTKEIHLTKQKLLDVL